MTQQEEEIKRSRLIPTPHSILFPDDGVLKLDQNCHICLHVPPSISNDLIQKTANIARRYWCVTPNITIGKDNCVDGVVQDGYRIAVAGENQITISASTENGVLNALKTLRQLAEVERGTEHFTHYTLPHVKIEDSPSLAFRAIHLSWFPETQFFEIEKALRLAAYYKFNYAIIEFWGVFPFESYPQLSWREQTVDRKELKKLILLGREFGITCIPQLNLLGHGSGARSVSSKHCVIDLNSALQSLFEPEGWSWCLSNPYTRSILSDAVIELYDFFEQPGYFHIGFDEAEDVGTCQVCRKNVLHELILDHLLHFYDLFKKRNCTLIMWHDMLLERNDSRWENYIVCGHPEQKLSQLVDDIPKDVIIADWQYGYPKIDGQKPSWPTMTFFKQKGFQVLACPWHNQEGILSLGEIAEREQFMGVLGTSWHHLNGFNQYNIFYFTTQACWGIREKPRNDTTGRLIFGHHLRQIGWDMNVTEYQQTGCAQYQITPESNTGNW